ncbi:MAG: anthranilate synthase component I [Candidatus Latescibacteria bacterium]|nr:anthranilate synthase component I [Candidatus Latescibacterota bacterium]
MHTPTREHVLQLITQTQANVVPVWVSRPIGSETPETAFLKVCRESPYAFLLESLEGDERVARYSFVGADPLQRLVSTPDGLDVISGAETQHLAGNPVDRMREVMRRYRTCTDGALPRFSGGAVGYFAYDVVRSFEAIPDENPDELGLPDLHFIIAGSVIAFDHVQQQMFIIANAVIDRDGPDAAYTRAIDRIDELIARLRQPVPPTPSSVRPLIDEKSPVTANLTPEAFQDAVRRAKEYIAAGDVFQVVLSQRFSVGIDRDPFDIYRALTALNPSPYLYYLRLDGLHIVGASPETMVQVDAGQVVVRPIAGTKRRGASEAEDDALSQELLNDPKERAEHVMLVDLGRNDVGRVCEYGTVQTTELMAIEKYSHVIHIVSNVVGRLRDGLDGFDVLRATFPAGTLSGAPKIRAMEIIDELETTRRGVYGGALGYIGFSGNLDLCITIRTMVITDGRAFIQAGAGIVADSIPEAEHIECANKAAALLRAIQHAKERS